jgi:hypothetical protein
MEVLIISLPRTGSSALLRKISEENKLKPIREPFNDFYPEVRYYDENYTYNDCVLKTNIFQKPPDVNESNRIDWLINLSQKFTSTILLSRKDLQSCIESWAFFNYKAKERKLGYDIEYYWEKTPNYEIAEQDIVKWNEELKIISKKLDVPITYYEDNFNPNSKDRLRKGNLIIDKII